MRGARVPGTTVGAGRKPTRSCPRRGTAPGVLRCTSFACSVDDWSEPDPDARDNPGVLDVPGLRATLIRGSAVGALPDHADIGRELPMELVAQPETGFDRAQPAANSDRRIVLAPGFALDQPLADQPVGEQHLVLGFRADPDLARVAHVGGCLDLEPVRGKTDDAKRGIGARRTAAKAEVM